MEGKRFSKLGIWLVVVLGAFDAITTLIGIRAGRFSEANPLLNNALTADVFWFLLLKGGLTLFWVGIMLREIHRSWLRHVHLGIAGGYACIVARSCLLLL